MANRTLSARCVQMTRVWKNVLSAHSGLICEAGRRRRMELSQYRAALYIRLSREDEGYGPSQSVSNQRALLEDYAKKQEIHIHDIYIDEAVIIGLKI